MIRLYSTLDREALASRHVAALPLSQPAGCLSYPLCNGYAMNSTCTQRSTIPVAEVARLWTSPIPVAKLSRLRTSPIPVAEVARLWTSPIPVAELSRLRTSRIPVAEVARLWTSPGLSKIWRLRPHIFATVLIGSMLSMAAAHAQTPVEATAETASGQGVGTEKSLSQSAVRQALRELESDQLQIREAAELKLIGMGVAVLPHLPELTPRTGGELRVRLQRVRQTLQQTKISHDFEPSTITLEGKMRLADAIDHIMQQTQNSIRVDNREAADRLVELAVSNAPFWEVISSLMQKANLRVNPFGSTESELVLSPIVAEEHQAGAQYSTGPFRMDMTSVRSTLPFNSSIGGQLELSFTLTWEPRLKPIYMQVPMSAVRAELASGRTLVATNAQAAPEIPLDLGGCSTQIDILVQRPERSAVSLSQLSGEFSIAIPSQRHEYVFPNFSSGTRQAEKFGDVTVTLEGARRNGPVTEVRLYVDFGDSQGALDSFRGWIMSNEAYLLDATGQRIKSAGSTTYAITPNAAGIAYLFEVEGNAQDYRLVYESPSAISMQTVKYNLRDIELP